MFSKIKNRTLKSLSIALSSIMLILNGAPLAFAASGAKSSVSVPMKINVPRSYSIPPERQLTRRNFFRKYIYSISQETLREQLDYEIKRYINRAPDVFKIDERLIRYSDIRALLINIATLNYLFDKYHLFTERFISFKRQSQNKVFILTFEPNATFPQGTTSDLSGFYLNNMDNYLSRDIQAQSEVLYNKLSSRKLCEAYESIMVDTFGRLMVFFYAIDKHHINLSGINAIATSERIRQMMSVTNGMLSNPNYVRKKPLPTPYDKELAAILNSFSIPISNKSKEETLNGLQLLKPSKQREYVNIIRMISTMWSPNAVNIETTLQSEASAIKENITRSIDASNFAQCPMGTYGQTEPSEFLAEAFAHLECSDHKKVSKLGKETEKFIVEKMKYLPKTKAMFCKK